MKHTTPIIVSLIAALGTVGCFNDACPVGNDLLSDECPYQLYRHQPNGWLITNPVVSFVFWGDWWAGGSQSTPIGLVESSGIETSESIQSTWTMMFSTDTLFDKVAEYGIANPILDANYYQYGNSLPSVTSIPSTTNQIPPNYTVWDDGGQNVQNEINGEIVSGVLPTPTSNTIYVIILPPYFTTVGMVKGSADGYHSHGIYGTINYEFAIITYGVPQYINSIVSHELYESATDPGNGSGYFDDKTGMEVADVCNWVATPVSIASYDTYTSAVASATTVSDIVVQKVWSQATCQCH